MLAFMFAVLLRNFDQNQELNFHEKKGPEIHIIENYIDICKTLSLHCLQSRTFPCHPHDHTLTSTSTNKMAV